MRAFSLNDGGPFYRAMLALHLVRPSGMVRSAWIALAAWLPVVIGEGIRVALGLAPDPTFYDLSVHVRLLVAMPLILFAERLTEPACRSGIRSLYEGKLCPSGGLDPIVARGEQLRDAWLPEAIVLVLAFTGGQLALWSVIGPTGLFHGGTGAGAFSFPRVWYVAIALPLAQFVMFRWLWRWAIWSYMLVRIARLDLTPIPTHPDRAAGLSCVARPVSGFGGFAAAVSAVLAAAWGTQVLAGRTTVKDQLPALVVFMIGILVLAVAALLPFSRHLYRSRRRGLAHYGDFASEYMRSFHDKWIAHRAPGTHPLGSSDIQSLNDLGGAYSVVSTTRLFAFGMRSILAVWASAIIPMVPLLASTLTFEKLLGKILGAIVGGFPL